MSDDEVVTKVRLEVMRVAVESGRLPEVADTASSLGLSTQVTRDSYRRLHEGHVFVLEPGSTDRLRMANPFSGVPTPFLVTVGDRSWWGNCVWDSFGIVAVLGGNGTVATTCPDCGEQEIVRFTDGELSDGTGIACIGVPARAWWNDIIYT